MHIPNTPLAFQTCFGYLGSICFGFKWFQEIIFRKIGCLVGFENITFRKLFSFDHTKLSFDPGNYFQFLFSLQSISKERERKPRSQRERKKRLRRWTPSSSLTTTNWAPVWLSNHANRQSQHRVDRTRSHRSCRSQHRAARSRLRRAISPSPSPRDLNLIGFD